MTDSRAITVFLESSEAFAVEKFLGTEKNVLHALPSDLNELLKLGNHAQIDEINADKMAKTTLSFR